MNWNESILLFDEKDILIDFIKKEDKSLIILWDLDKRMVVYNVVLCWVYMKL